MKENSLPLKTKIKKLLNQQILAVLATQDSEYPYNTLVAYAYTEDLKSILFATMKNTSKYHNIQIHPNVSMLIDNRTNNPIDFKDAVALTILGRTKITKEKECLNLYLYRFPYLKEFVENPKTALIRMEIDRYIFIQRFQEVLELKMK